MKKLLIVIVVAVGAFLIYKNFFKKNEPAAEEPKPISVSKHSDVFNRSVDDILNGYYQMTEGFVNWDADKVNTTSTGLQKALDSLKVDELKKDSSIYQTILFPWDNAKNNIAAIVSSVDWNGKRRALQDLSDNLRTLLLTVKYDRAVVYWQECPMAFGEGMAGNWLSRKQEVINPYLGNKDPQYGATMLNCGENKSKIDFIEQDSTNIE